MPSREDLAARAGDPTLADLPLFAGEAGIPKENGAPEGNLSNYVFNTDRLGYDATFLWQLEGDLIDTSGRRRAMTRLGLDVAHVLSERRRGRRENA
jgi:hypothetical protein